MIKKKDLVKQFELVVQQEIIEHNKAISSSNLAVNKLNEKLNEIKDEFHKNILNLRNDQSRVFRDLEKNSDAFIRLKDAFQSLRNDQFILNERNYKEIEVIDQSVETVHKNFKNLVKQFELLQDLTNTYMDKVIELKKIHEDGVYNVRYKLSKDINNLRKDIVSLPSEKTMIKLKEELLEILSMNKIDNEGLLKEIKVLKKTAFINEKKIEDLYMRIEKINKKVT